MIINRILNYSDKNYYFNIESIGSEAANDKTLKFIVTDGINVWESFKILWNDLIQMKPDGIEASVQSSAISLALLGIPVADLKEEDLVVEIVEMRLTKNLNLCWKLKQMLGITIVLGAVILLKQTSEEIPSKLLHLLSDSIAASKLRTQLTESLELNRKLMGELEKIVKKKIEDEDELYTKFRVLLNQYKPSQ